MKNKEHTTNTISSLAEEIKERNSSFKRIESDVAVSKVINDAMVKQVASRMSAKRSGIIKKINIFTVKCHSLYKIVTR